MIAACRCAAGLARHAYQPAAPQAMTNAGRDSDPSDGPMAAVTISTMTAGSQPGIVHVRWLTVEAICTVMLRT
jgi:hypothetical protein